jgi:c-di-GMP-binding flagellar brake protein YcgR
VVRINDRVQMEIGGRTYHSRVEDIHDDCIYFGSPMDGCTPIRLRLGQKVIVEARAEGGVHRSVGNVKTTLRGRVTLVVLHQFQFLGIVEHRDCDRVNDEVTVRYRIASQNGAAVSWKTGVTSDLSASGLQMTGREAWTMTVGDQVVIDVMIGGGEPISATAEIARMSPIPGSGSKSIIGLAFLSMTGSERDRLIRYIRHRQVELKRSRNLFVHCDRRVVTTFSKRTRQATGPTKTGWAFDMTDNGLRMITDDASGLSDGDTLDVSIKLRGWVVIKSECEIIWVRHADRGEGGSYEIGVRFNNISKAGRQAIDQFLSQINEDGPSRRLSAA